MSKLNQAEEDAPVDAVDAVDVTVADSILIIR